ncbi:hypothetical protein QM467_11010 [Rhodoblastus sp. 17X3]|uniref:hypothetical protein n=1 Tax=Rhodoblastus sp. 17X3 TaxID=3047026 RepID=UPI0024B663F1|nr:hypothetical protein [Rhodoblastus sp. 17X3]MDI9848584.1 hypothetical protein [Rhodoblastus sp. 17X3]
MIRRSLLVFALAALLGTGLQALWFGSLPTMADVRWVHDILMRKKEIAAATPAPKVLLIGSSSVHFGLDARLMSSESSCRFVNFGLHVLLGIDLPLREAEKVLAPGDSAVIFIEVGMLGSPFPVGDVLREYVRQHEPEQRTTPDYYFSTRIWEGLKAPALKLSGALFDAQPHAPPNMPKIWIYTLDHVDAFGDQTGKNPENISPNTLDAVVLRHFPTYRPPRTGPVLDRLLRFKAWADAHGVRVYGGWPPEYIGHEAGMTKATTGIAEVFAELGIPMIGSARDSFAPLSDLYDGANHLNDKGAEAFSRRFLANFQRQAGCAPASADPVSAKPVTR